MHPGESLFTKMVSSRSTLRAQNCIVDFVARGSWVRAQLGPYRYTSSNNPEDPAFSTPLQTSRFLLTRWLIPLIPPLPLGIADKASRQGPAQTFAEDGDGVVQETSMDVVPEAQRPSASVTEIPGASAQPMRINEIGSFKPSIAMKGLKTGAMSRELVDKTTRIDGTGTLNFTVVLWFLLGLMCKVTKPFTFLINSLLDVY